MTCPLFGISAIGRFHYICSIQNENETLEKWPDKWAGIFICVLLELRRICDKEKILHCTKNEVFH